MTLKRKAKMVTNSTNGLIAGIDSAPLVVMCDVLSVKPTKEGVILISESDFDMSLGS